MTLVGCMGGPITAQSLRIQKTGKNVFVCQGLGCGA